jgi:serine/threonine-protein kinase
MDAARWDRVQALFHLASELPAAEREELVAAEAGGDAALADHVRRLLAADAMGASLLDRPLGDMARGVLGAPGDAPLPPVGEFGPYRILRPVGEGGMGVVYLAERADLGSRVAIKVLRDAWLSPARRERFAAEQRTLAQLNHPGIARLYDAGALADGTPWIAMEYVDGATLTEYCRSRARSLVERLWLFREVCEAVQHAHRHLVVHRDLKPSNILVTPEGGVKLLDFGIAKQLEALDGMPAAMETATGVGPMTPAYAAPEQVRGERVGTYTDVHALGLILYELVVGRPPFDVANRTPREAASVVATEPVPRPSAVAGTAARKRRALWADLDVLCQTATQKEPERRYRTVDALIRDVDHTLGGEPLDARPDSVGHRLGKFVRRNRRPVAAVAVAVAVLVAVVTTYTVRLAEARDAALVETARVQRIQGFLRGVFQGGDEMVGPADSLRVVTLIDRGLDESERLKSDPAVHAEVLFNLADVYLHLGKFERADSLARSALAERRALFGDRHPDVVASVTALASIRRESGKLDDAERLAREALATGRRHLGPGHAAVIDAMHELGTILHARGATDSAIALLTEAVRLYRAEGTRPIDLSEAINTLANVHHDAGHYDVADSLNREALAISRRLYGDNHPSLGYDLINLGMARSQRGDYAGAERYVREGTRIFAAWFGADDHRTAGAESQLAQVLSFQDRTGEARTLLARVLGVQERAYGPNDRRVANTRHRIASIALAEGDYPAAEAEYTRVLAIFRAVHGGRDHPDVATALSSLASVALRQNQLPRAEGYMRQALAIALATLDSNHVDVGIQRLKLGRVLTRQQRWTEAEAPLLGGYRIVAEQSVPSSPWLKDAREDLAAVYEALGRRDEANKYRVAPVRDSLR